MKNFEERLTQLELKLGGNKIDKNDLPPPLPPRAPRIELEETEM